MIWFISDTHFRHHNIIESCKRSFKDTLEMDTVMIDNWNSCIKDNDTVYFLGDFCFGKAYNSILNKLKGKIFFIKGNHDKDICKGLVKKKHKRVIDVRDYFVLKHNNHVIILSHYPFLSWDRITYGSWHLHGHCHVMVDDPTTLRINVSADVIGFKPISFDQIEQIVKERNLFDYANKRRIPQDM